MTDTGADHAFVQIEFPHDLLFFDAVFLRILLKIKIVQHADRFPVLDILRIIALCKPAHHAGHNFRVAAVKILLVIALHDLTRLLN